MNTKKYFSNQRWKFLSMGFWHKLIQKWCKNEDNLIQTNSTQINNKTMEIKIPILCGSDFDLTKFDFSFKDISIYDINSEEFVSYIKGLKPNININTDFINDIRKQILSNFDKKYAIVKKNPMEGFNYQDILNVWHFLLIVYPSDLQIEYIINYSNHEDIEFSSMTLMDRRITGAYPGNLLITTEEEIVEVNEFAKLYFDRLNVQNYVGIAIENYLTSFAASHFHYQYLTLCIALESTINGNSEIIYRLKRTIAVLCGKDSYNSEIIYENLNKLYSLRSKIIHGEQYEMTKVIEYIKPLQAIVSRVIIELIIHGIPKNQELNEKITKLGFGDRAKISTHWKPYKLNILTMVESNWNVLTK